MIFAKLLQALGMAELLVALYFGIFLKDMGMEMVFLLLGLAFFILGTVIERRGTR